MPKLFLSLAIFCVLVRNAAAQTAPQYGQCGGNNWTGATTCPSGWSCKATNEWYSQCLPGAPSTIITDPPPGGTTLPPTTTVPAPGGVPTLVAGWNFIRAVTAPNFHKYLQSEVTNKVSDAVLGEANTAAQFQITNGQLIQSAGGTTLYAVVEPRADSTVMKLKVSWSTSASTSGAFKFSGDTVEWSNPSITRPQNNAWLVCADAAGHKDVYINLGPYSYQTPAGCNDHTIHGFTGTTPD
ncbi:carbohydrate-binding module family 1 protein [Crassisporium funariophilum]|nr:carbohydrate-binding module family 1 protein [Crassisporium funariophilum]